MCWCLRAIWTDSITRRVSECSYYHRNSVSLLSSNTRAPACSAVLEDASPSHVFPIFLRRSLLCKNFFSRPLSSSHTCSPLSASLTQGQWHIFADHTVSVSSFEECVSLSYSWKHPALLFYTRLDAHSRLAVPPFLNPVTAAVLSEVPSPAGQFLSFR